MLFILFGGTLEMSYACRCYFREQGFDMIMKYNYVSDAAPIDRKNYENPSEEYLRWFDDKVHVQQEEMERCDFRYQLNGVHVGFNKQQILDAIHGKKDCLVTLAASSISFIEQMKKAYGDYVTVINLFIDHETYKKQIGCQPHITDAELSARLAAELVMGECYLEKRSSFDEIAIYTGEHTIYNFENLKRQFRFIIQKRRMIEKKLNDKQYVELPYTGSEPYIFVSYSHLDKEQVYPILYMLQRHCFRVWYDDGITGGEDWRSIIAEKIEGCALFLLFSSASARDSVEVARELKGADLCKKKMLVVTLDQERLRLEYEMYLDLTQKIAADDPDFEQKLNNALLAETKQI